MRNDRATTPRARWTAHVLALAVLFVLCRLGLWQLDRAAYKAGIEAELRVAQAAPASPLPADPTAIRPWRRYRLNAPAPFAPETFYLLDNRVLNGRAGYDVLVDVPSSRDTEILLNIGWLPAPARRSEAPTLTLQPPAGAFEVLAAPRPSTGIDFQTGPDDALAPGIMRIQSADKVLPSPVPYLIAIEPLLAGASAHLPEIRFTEAKHRAYATQWFVMAIVFVVLYARLMRLPPFKRENPNA